MLDQLEAILPASLEQDALNPAVLQDAVDKLADLQGKARKKLFRVLAKHTDRPETLSSALACLCDHASYLMPDTPEALLAQYAGHYRMLCAQVSEISEAAAQEQAAADLGAQVSEFSEHLSKGDYTEAAWSVVRLRKTIKEAQEAASSALAAAVEAEQQPGEAGKQASGGVLVAEATAKVLEKQCEECEKRLKQAMAAGCNAVVDVDAAAGLLRVRSHLPGGPGGAGPAPAAELWGALQAQGTLGDRLDSIAGSLLTGVLEPLLRGGRSVSVTPASGPQEPAVLTWHEWPGAPHPEASCRQVLKLVGEVAFGLDGTLLRALGEKLWPRLTRAYVSLAAAPEAEAAAARGDAEAAEAVVGAAEGLEAWAEALGLVEEPLLGPAVAAAVAAALDSRQRGALAAVRTALLGDLGEDAASREPVTVGSPVPVDSHFYARLLSGQLPPWEGSDPPSGCDPTAPLPASRGQCLVGQGMVEVVRLVGAMLDDAVASGSKPAARSLVAGVRKAALLARILPSALPGAAARLEGVPLLALRHANGLRHLADSLLLMQPAYGPVLEPLAGEPLGLVREALLLRDAARELQDAQVAAQATHFTELLQGLGGLARLGKAASAQAGIGYRKTVRQVLHSLGRLGRVLVATLPPEPLVSLAAQVLGTVCGPVVRDVLGKRDIGIDDCAELKDILGPLASDALPTLLGLDPAACAAAAANAGTAAAAAAAMKGPAVSGVPLELVRHAVASRCAPLRKLGSLLRILDAGMRDIVAMWERRELQADGYTCEEVSHLVEALFEASEYRRDALARIRASSW